MQRFLFIILFFSFSVLAHQNSLTATQKEIRWNYTNVPVRIVNNSTTLPSSGNLIESAIAEWNAASNFQMYKSTSGSNQIKFSNDFSLYGSSVIGLTELSYSTTGSITSATILLNEQNYRFTSTPGMPNGNQIYLKDVITHELGHFAGLAHSEVLDSTMFYSNFPGQSELAADDIAGIKNKYNSGHGQIVGSVKGGAHIGVLGVHVQAISRKTGEAIGGISDENGDFVIGGLDLNDTYYLYTSPLKNLEALPGYFSSMQTAFCPGSYVGSFFSACGRENDGLPSGINLTTLAPSVNVGEISINCTTRTQENYNLEKIGENFSALSIFNYADEQRWEKSYVGYFHMTDLSTSLFSAADKLTIDLSGLEQPNGKKLKIRLISQPLGHALEYAMDISQNGLLLSGSPFGKTLNSPEGTFQLDLAPSFALSSTSSQNIFEIGIQAKKLSSLSTSYSIPDFSRFASQVNLPYLLILSLESSGGPLLDSGSVLSDNSSCLDAPFTYSVEKSEVASDKTTSASSSQDAAVAAACSTVGHNSGPPGPGSGPFITLVTLGFMLTWLGSRIVKRGKNFLS